MQWTSFRGYLLASSKDHGVAVIVCGGNIVRNSNWPLGCFKLVFKVKEICFYWHSWIIKFASWLCVHTEKPSDSNASISFQLLPFQKPTVVRASNMDGFEEQMAEAAICMTLPDKRTKIVKWPKTPGWRDGGNTD